MNHKFEIYVSYSQVAVFLPELQEPFNPWTDDDVEKGFSWRPGSVSFRTTVEAGEHSIRVCQDGNDVGAKSIVRSAIVPFEVPENGLVEVGSISDSRVIAVEPGLYSLTFELLGHDEQATEILLLFTKA